MAALRRLWGENRGAFSASCGSAVTSGHPSLASAPSALLAMTVGALLVSSSLLLLIKPPLDFLITRSYEHSDFLTKFQVMISSHFSP